MEDEHTAELFAGVDALLAQAAARLPDAAERQRLRQAAGLSPQQVATALQTTPDLVEAWEAGLTEPPAAQRAAYARLLDGLLAQERARHTTGNTSAAPSPHDHTNATPTPPAASPAPAPTPSAPPARAPKPHTASPAASGKEFPAGPLAVLAHTGALTAHLADGTTHECPADTLVDLLHWALQAGLGQPKLSTYDRPADPLVVLTSSAADYLGLPLKLDDRARLRLPDDHPVIADLARDGWNLSRSGFGSWARIYQKPEPKRRRCIQMAILPWGALSDGGWNTPGDLTPSALARWLGTYADRVLTPCGSTAVCGQQLMTALRPPTRPARSADGTWHGEKNPAGLWQPLDPAPPEAHDEHPLAQGRDPLDALDEEAWDWQRPLTPDEELTYPYVVGIDINFAFAAAASSAVVGMNAPPEHTTRPVFDPKVPGSWYCDLSHVDHDPRLPSPFTPSGQPPTGPAWYATPTLAYAAELGADIEPLEAYLRHDSSRYFDPWYKHLRDAYLATMEDLGITPDMSPTAFLTAMRNLHTADPAVRALLAAIKATSKGGIGKLRAGPRDPRRAPYTPWPALNTPTWRPDLRAVIISRTRVNTHRKMRKTAQLTGRYPLAVLSDCVIYPAHEPTALDVVPHGDSGTGVSGAFRLGVTPGWVKEEGTRTIDWYQQILDDGANPARYVKDITT
ncbi:telomere-associated protein Tap [Streptomyces botrytidirepellens]|uniref:XRE family transcriptional regulator n=1 Tax=Streptomyces botrytidirepellens TaxID=2486417 RepID=A0A3M8VM31_9ACTN|nr:helix-turn-helix domain-containing protein [Streptomyces botrytidirepellens]RNG17859.1 XRE family transcriptional regulator [Streptomyces botrytidirepellens]